MFVCVQGVESGRNQASAVSEEQQGRAEATTAAATAPTALPFSTTPGTRGHYVCVCVCVGQWQKNKRKLNGKHDVWLSMASTLTLFFVLCFCEMCHKWTSPVSTRCCYLCCGQTRCKHTAWISMTELRDSACEFGVIQTLRETKEEEKLQRKLEFFSFFFFFFWAAREQNNTAPRAFMARRTDCI